MQVEQETLNICVTGAAGQIGYSFIPQLCLGKVLGPNVRINLKMLDIEPMQNVLKALEMEIIDCAYPLVNSVQYSADPKVLFKDLDLGIFFGGFPRKAGMERKDLLKINGGIFKTQGEALNLAKPSCRVLVVANPANTNCMILQKYCQTVPKENFTCMTRLDHNRSLGEIAIKAGVSIEKVKNVIVWGNHSATMYPDVAHGTVDGKKIMEVVKDEKYVQEEFIKKIQTRGAEIIKVKGTSSVFSAANGAVTHLRDWYLGQTDKNEWLSTGLLTEGEHYGLGKGVFFSFPVKFPGKWKIEVVDGLEMSEFAKSKIKITEDELLAEQKEALEMLA